MLYIPANAVDRIKEYHDKGEKICLRHFNSSIISPKSIDYVWGITVGYATIYISRNVENCLNKLEEAEIEDYEIKYE